jgi:uncharacterized protein YbaR (Trm112 family)
MSNEQAIKMLYTVHRFSETRFIALNFKSKLLYSLTKEKKMPISKELLEILACPKCKGDIFLNRKGDGLICKACHLLYPIKDDIPVMLIDEALPYQGEE